MDSNSIFVSGKPNPMKMRQPEPIRTYRTASAPDLCKKIDSFQNFKLSTAAGVRALYGGLHLTGNLETAACAKSFKSMDSSKIDRIKPLTGSALNSKIVSSRDNSFKVTTGCKTISNNCALISRSKSMPPDLNKFVYNCNLPMMFCSDIFGHFHPGADSKQDTDSSKVTDNSADGLVLSENHKKENKCEKRHMFMKNYESIKIFHSLDETDIANCHALSAIIPLLSELKQSIGEQSFLKRPRTECENENDITPLTQKIDLDMDVKIANKSDSKMIELTDNSRLNNMTTHTVDDELIPNDTISAKKYSLLNGDGGHTKADAKKETEKIIASPSLPDSNTSQLARCQIDKIELNITEINAECEGVTVACLEKNSRPVSNYHINDNDQKLSPITDNHRNYSADSNGQFQSPLSFDTVDHASVVRVQPNSAKREPGAPHAPDRRIAGRNYPSPALKVQSEVVDKTMQVSEGIDAILKRLGRHDDKSTNDTMKSHDNSLHRLSAGDGSGQGQQKVSRFLLKRAQEKEAAKKAEKEQCDSVLSCEDKMNKLKQLFSKKSDFISASAIDDGFNIVRLPTAVAESDTQSRSSVLGPVEEKQYSNDIFDKQNSLIKSDHNFYHTEAADGSVDCLREIGQSDIIKCENKVSENICKSLTIATETEIIDEKEIKCQIILPDPVSQLSETSNDNVNSTDRLTKVDSEEKNATETSKCSTPSVKLDCDSIAIGSGDKSTDDVCDKSTETTLCAVENDIKCEPEKSAPASVVSGLTEVKPVTVAEANEKMTSESVKPVIDNVEDKMAKLKAMLAEKKKKSKCISNKPAIVNLECENVQTFPTSDPVKEIKASRALDSEKSILTKKSSTEESKPRKASVKLPVLKSAHVLDSCKVEPECPKVKNEPERPTVDINKEPLTINDVEGSMQTVVENNSNQLICLKAPRTRVKGKSVKKDNKKHKIEPSLKKHRHKERDDYKRDIRDDLNFDADVGKMTGPLYFSTETLQLHTDSKKKHHGKKSKSNVRDRLDKCINFISSLPAKVAICKPSVLEMRDENLPPNQSCDEFVMVDKDELAKNCISDKKKPGRVRLPSECESEDSFVICFQGSQEDLRNDSDNSDDDGDSACSETDSSDDDDDSTTGSCSSDDGYEGLAKKADDDVDSGVIVGIMKKRGYRDSPGRSANKDKKVSFTTAPPKVHKMIAWSYAYRQARIGTWERCARDAERFRQRVRDTSLSLDWVLKDQHRRLVFFHRFSPLLMRAIREEKEAKAKKAIEDKEKAIKDKEIEEELLKQKEIEDREEAERLEKISVVIVDDILNEKVDNFKDASSVTVSNDDNLAVVDTVRDKSPVDNDKLLIVQKNEKCDLNTKINNVSNAKKGSLTVRTGKNGTRNVKSVSPLK